MTNQSGQRNATIRCGKTMCGEMNCLDCYPLPLPEKGEAKKCLHGWYRPECPSCNPLLPEPPVERPELPAMDVTEGDRKAAWSVLYDRFGELPVPQQRVNEIQADLTRREAQLLEARSELLAAQSRISQLEKEKSEGMEILFSSGPIRCCNGISHMYEKDCLYCVAEKAEAERDQLKSERDEAVEQIRISQDAIAGCTALREWGRCTINYFGSQIIGICNQLVGGINTINAVDADRNRLQRRLDAVLRAHGQLSDSYSALLLNRGGLQAKLDAALAITNTPEWFDTPCARAVREVVGEK